MSPFELERLNDQRVAELAWQRARRHEATAARRARKPFLVRVTLLAQFLFLQRIG